MSGQCLLEHEQTGRNRNVYTRVEVWWRIFVRNAVKCGEKNNFQRVFLTSFCGECGESQWIIVFHRLMRWIIFFTASSGEKKIIHRLRESGEKEYFIALSGEKKIINRHRERGEKNNSRQFTAFTAKTCRKYAVIIIFFSTHSTEFLTKVHFVLYQFPLLNFSYLNQRFSCFFCQTRHHQTAHCRQSPSATISFHCWATFTHFFQLFKSFKQNR